MTPATPLKIASSSVLSQDHLASNQVLADLTSATPVSVFRNPYKSGATEALVISPQGNDSQLCYLKQSADSATGWQLEGLTTPQWGAYTAVEVVAFATTWNTVEAYFIGLDGNLYHLVMNTDGTKWRDPRAVDGAPQGMSHISVTYQPGATNNSQTPTYVAAITDDSKMFILSSSDGSWSAWTGDQVSALQNYDSIAVTAPSSLTRSGGWEMWVWSVQDDSLDFTAIETAETHIESDDVAEVDGGTILGIAIPSDTAPPVAIVGTSTGITWVTWALGAGDGGGGIFTFYQGQLELPTAISQGTVVQLENGLVNVYLVDTDDQVWLVPVTSWTPQGSGDYTPNFGTPILLNTGIGVVFADVMPADTPTLIGVDKELGALHLNYQDPSTGYWRTGAMVLPATKQYSVPRWRTEIALYDDHGEPVPNYPLTVAADSAVDLAVGGQFYYADRKTPATATTNALGKATLATLATGLSTAKLTVKASDLPQAVTISPHQGISDYMAGTGTLPGMSPLSGDTLKKATVDGQPLAPKLQDPSSGFDPHKIAHAMQSVARLPNDSATSPAAAPADEVRYLVLTKLDPAGPTYQEYRTVEELDALYARVHAASPLSFWDDVWDWAGDIWEGIEQAVITVSHIAIHLKDKVVKLIIKIGETLYKLAAFSVKTVEDALHGIESIFNWIGAEVDKVIDWLKAIFDFGAIWNTKTALESGITHYLTGMGDGIDAFSNYFSGKTDPIAKLKGTLDQQLDQAIQKFSGKKFSDLSGWQTPGQPPSQAAGPNSTPSPATYSDNVHANWFHDQVLTNAPTSIGGTSGSQGQTEWNNLVKALENVTKDLEQAFHAFAKGFSALFKVHDLSTLGDVVITTFLSLIKDLLNAVLDAADALIQAILALSKVVVDALEHLLEADISIGFLNTLYDWIAGWAGVQKPPPLTPAGLFSLLIAFPTTVVFKLAVGADKEPFPNGKLPGAGGGLHAPTGTDAGMEPSSSTAWLSWSSEMTGAIVTSVGFIPAILRDVADDELSWASTWATVGTIVGAVATLAPTVLPDAIDWTKALSQGGAELVAALGTALIMGVVAFSGLLATLGKKILAAKDTLRVLFTIWGVAQLAYEIYTVVEDYDELTDSQIASDFMAPWGSLMSIAGVSWVKDTEIYPFALAFQIVGDLLGSLGSGIAEVEYLLSSEPSLA